MLPVSLVLAVCPPVFAAAADRADGSSPRFAGSASPQPEEITIPGPLRSFLRMGGMSQQVPPDDVLPQLARSVYFLGFSQQQPTEFLLLLQRYVRQARALQALAGSKGEILVAKCADAGPLLRVLGYSLQGGCGNKDAALVTQNPESAFLTIDSGFPLTRLEEALQNDAPFAYAYAASRVPVILRRSEWTSLAASGRGGKDDLLDALLDDQHVARLYWAFSNLDIETAATLQRSVGLAALLPYAPVLDFYGSQLCVRSKRVLVPGGDAAEPAWRELVGASPRSPGEFVARLLAQDRGWLAAYFDTLARVPPRQQARLTADSRLRRLYDAFRGPKTEAYAAGATFRRAPALLVLFNRQQWLADGDPVLPGSVALWKQILGKQGRRARTPEQILETLVSCARAETGSGPLQIYLALSDLDRARAPQRKTSTETLLLMAEKYQQYGSWYPVFSEFPELTDASIVRFLHLAEAVDRIPNADLRGDALGTFQANLGLWQILARQREIPKAELDASWQAVVDPFQNVGSATQLFDAGEKSLGKLMFAATGKGDVAKGEMQGEIQDELVALLAGPPPKGAQAEKVRAEMARRIQSVMSDQRLVALDTLLELNRDIASLARGGPRSERMLALAGDLREFEMPRQIFTETEKYEWAPDIIRQRHVGLQAHADLAKMIEQPGPPAKLEAARGLLAPFLRDTLVGLNYAYYEPPGSQLLHINPLFVRSHDFAASTIVGVQNVWQPSTLFGSGASAGGGAYLIGSLADLPYVLAAAEQNFISPENVQALIWQELVPSLLAGATISRWWNVDPRELHAVALYQQMGEELIRAAADNEELRGRVLAILGERVSPQRLSQVEAALRPESPSDALLRLTPADGFYLAAEFRQRFPQESVAVGPGGRALDKLSREAPAEVGLERISRDFGTPHPTLAETYGRELVNGKPFPPFSGNSNRLFGESWDSNNLYWARLADERHDAPEALNLLSPQLTRRMIAKIFASDIEDWPAVVRAMHETGEEWSQGKLDLARPVETAARP
jgi:hypothetical protein